MGAASTISCADAICSDQQCCYVPDTCASYAACNLTVGDRPNELKASRGNLICPEIGCTDTECCYEPKTCEEASYNCRNQGWDKKPADLEVECVEGICDDDTCCFHPLNCAGTDFCSRGPYDCTDGGMELKSNQDTLWCVGNCADNDCCFTPKTCATEGDSHACQSGALPKGDAANINCTNGVCDDPVCCYTPVKCKAHSCPGGHFKSAQMETGCPESGCSDSLCCYTPGKCSSHSCATGKNLITAATSTDCAEAGCSDTVCCEASTDGLPRKVATAAATDTAVVSTVISGIDYAKMTDATKTNLKVELVKTYATAAGTTEDQVKIELSAGSVMVVATITAAEGETIDEVKVPDSASVVNSVKSVEGIDEAFEDGATIAVSEHKGVLFKKGETTATEVTPVTTAVTRTSFAARTIPIMAIVIGVVSLDFS